MRPRKKPSPKKATNNINYIGSEENLKYLSRSFYVGTLNDFLYTDKGLALKFQVFTTTTFFSKTTKVCVYVPTDLEESIADYLITGNRYFIVTAPYNVSGINGYAGRVELLLNIFEPLDQ